MPRPRRSAGTKSAGWKAIGVLAAAVLTVPLLSAPASGAGAPGRLDRTFASRGTLVVPLTAGVYQEWGERLGGLLRGPGTGFRVVTAGSHPTEVESSEGVITVRAYRANGKVNTAFNGGKPRLLKVLSSSPGPGTGLGAVASDDRARTYLFVGTGDTGDFLGARIYRVTETGRRDRSYSAVIDSALLSSLPGSGPLNSGAGGSVKMAVLPDGRARVCIGGAREVYLVGFGADGRIEATYGASGVPGVAVYTHATTTSFEASCGAMATSRDGRVFVPAAMSYDSGGVIAFSPDGRPDAAFGVDGYADYSAVDAVVSVEDITVTRAGVVYLVCWQQGSGGAPGTDFLARLTPSGTFDPGFGTAGRAELTGIGSFATLSIGSADRMYLAHGDTVTRLRQSTGAVDAAFGTAGSIRVAGLSRVTPLTSTRILLGLQRRRPPITSQVLVQKRYA